MSGSKLVYRDACKRLHRVVANFFAVKAWCSNADCVILSRTVLTKPLKLERVYKKRVKLIIKDMEPWFRYIHPLYAPGTDSLKSLYLSRVPIKHWMKGRMTDTERAKLMNKEGVNTLAFSERPSSGFTESEMLTELTLMASGLNAPKTPIFVEGMKRK